MDVAAEPETSYAGLLVMSASLLLFVGLLSVFVVPAEHLIRSEYRYFAAFLFIAYAPVLLIVNRRWFRVIAALFVGAWLVFLFLFAWGGPGIEAMLLPVPLIVAWFLPPAPPDARTFLTIVGGAAVAVITVITVSTVVPEEGDVVYVCTDRFVDATIMDDTLFTPHPVSGFSLPPGVRSAGAAIGGHAFRFDPFTQNELEAFVVKAEHPNYVTEVRVNQQCPPWP